MINGKYHTERICKGEKIVIDIAEICGRYEIAVLGKGGKELEMETVRTIQEARDIYAEYLKKYPESPAPLTGKYQKLADDLKTAIETGKAAEAKNPEDGGASNFDATLICLKGWTEKKVIQAAKEAGTTAQKYRPGLFVINPITNGQADARSRNEKATTAKLSELGYQTADYCCMD
ncbi:hypothetical protein [Bilifractor porci]|uniref:Uncharacterized protein n=1 Tax=Bilifractor porci TaxID=2606636 RepID=A0A7X2P8A4_9FIRM|nr:hypothetical protein [Bilifractor porci]MST81568.1 hypothetical protein [Bilifractor porci]